MNSVITKTAAIICTLAVSPVFAPAGAAEWISLSDWAYPEVSGFVSDGLLTERLKSESDYTHAITRGEFAELLYSVLLETGRIMNTDEKFAFDDCDGYPDVNRLYGSLGYDAINSANGESFRPEDPMLRADAALLMFFAMSYDIGVFDPGDWEEAPVPPDAEGLSDDAKTAVKAVMSAGIMTGSGDGNFSPDAELSIEQATAALYRLYKSIPRLISSDNELADETADGLIQTYDCGLSELYRDGQYVISDGARELISFEADVYSKLLCGEYGGKRLVFAVNFNDKTDVYDIDSGAVLYTIPYIVYRLGADSVYVYSSRFMPAYSGLYSPDGTELIAPEYSESELKEIAANGYKVPEDSFREPDGQIFYSNWNDKGHMYKMDSNGENKQLLVDDADCTQTWYYDGMLYYTANEDGSLRCVDENGGHKFIISDSGLSRHGTAKIIFDTTDTWEEEKDRLKKRRDVNGNKWSSMFFLIWGESVGPELFGGYLLFSEYVDYEKEVIDAANGESYTQEYGAWDLYIVRVTDSGVEKRQIADFPISNEGFDGAGEKMYFLNADELAEHGDSPIYVFDGETVSDVSPGLRVESFGFIEENGELTNRIGYLTNEEIGEGTYHVIDLSDGSITSERLEPYVERDDSIVELLNENGLKLPYNYDDERELVVEYNGKKKSLGHSGYITTIGDTVYYSNNEMRGIVISSGGLVRTQAYTMAAYNYKTGETRELCDDFDGSFTYELPDGGMIYRNVHGQNKLITAGGADCLTVYPNKGLHRYGETARITHLDRVSWQRRFLYKIDTEGNITQLTDFDTENWLYVPKGSKTPTMSS